MKIWRLTKSKQEYSTSSTWERLYADPLLASKELFEQYTTRFNLYNDDAIIAEYHPATGANLVLKDGCRWTWAIDMLEVAEK